MTEEPNLHDKAEAIEALADHSPTQGIADAVRYLREHCALTHDQARALTEILNTIKKD